jgi:hypothetical protein
MAQSKSGVAFAVTHSLEKAKARYPWAKAWVQVKGGMWCFESEAEARGYKGASTSHSSGTNRESRSGVVSDGPRRG